MRDFEGESADSDDYRKKYSECIKEVQDKDSLHELPYFRLTVDERVCDPKDLCDGGDPEECHDVGGPRDSVYIPGTVSKCYHLIDEAKAEQGALRKAELLDQVAAECTNEDHWKDYENAVKIYYCLWKHLQVGVCMNSMRTNCPTVDSSCCPVPQNDPEADPSDFRKDLYTCEKSPLVGLYCHHVEWRVPTNGSLGALCTEVNCPSSFAWCRDFADVPGLCYGDACKDYNRALGYLLVCIVCLSAGCFMDLLDLVVLFRYPHAAAPKSAGNVVGASMKFMTYVLCLAGGVQEFSADVVQHGCFNEKGKALTESVEDLVRIFGIAALATGGGSLLLAPMSMRWGGHLVGLPYARVK